MVEENEGDLTSTGTEDEPFMGESSSTYYETDLDLLVDLGMLAETENGYEIASHAELYDLPDNERIPPSERNMAMNSVLHANEVDWCGEPERGRDFRDEYLDTFADEDDPAYTTKAEYLESIEDYIDCGDGHI